eukprot:m.67031 g.67031  ORF g.67031 m.67031 type:complete len:182 (+) comp18160_c0_seq1:585-1130(+)
MIAKTRGEPMSDWTLTWSSFSAKLNNRRWKKNPGPTGQEGVSRVKGNVQIKVYSLVQVAETPFGSVHMTVSPVTQVEAEQPLTCPLQVCEAPDNVTTLRSIAHSDVNAPIAVFQLRAGPRASMAHFSWVMTIEVPAYFHVPIIIGQLVPGGGAGGQLPHRQHGVHGHGGGAGGELHAPQVS